MSAFDSADNPPGTKVANPTFIDFTNPVGAGDFDGQLPRSNNPAAEEDGAQATVTLILECEEHEDNPAEEVQNDHIFELLQQSAEAKSTMGGRISNISETAKGLSKGAMGAAMNPFAEGAVGAAMRLFHGACCLPSVRSTISDELY